MRHLAQLSNSANEIFTDYRYRSNGTGSFVYIVDSGLDWDGNVFNNRPFIFKNFHLPEEVQEDIFGSGTNVAALAVGKDLGVAPAAGLGVINIGFRVRIGGQNIISEVYTKGSLSFGILTALESIVSRHEEKNSVICLSLRKYIIHTFLWTLGI
jgi:hypothetical protein